MSKYEIIEPLPKFGDNTARFIEAPYELVKQIRADVINEFANNVICELKSRHTDMPVIDILGTREKWKEKNLQYLECENLVYKIAKKLKEKE